MGQAQDLDDAHCTYNYYFKYLVHCKDEKTWNRLMRELDEEMRLALWWKEW